MKKPLGIYIDLDSLLDTRIGTLMLHDHDLALQTIDDSDYYFRLSEEIKGIDSSLFKDLYSRRDVETLKHSTVTNIIILLKEFIASLITQLNCHPLYDKLKLYVNTYPYILNDDERNSLYDIIQQHTYTACEVEIIYKDIKDVDCLWVYNNIGHIFMYSYHDWLNLRAKELAHRGLPYVNLYCPRLYFDHIPTEDEEREFLELKGEMNLDQFSYTAEMFKAVIQINFLPIDHFCIINNQYSDLLQSLQTENTEDTQNTS